MTSTSGTYPALYEHAHAVYSAMKEAATLETMGPDSEDEGLVYEGYLTKLVTSLGLSVPYYTAVTRVLKDMGCIVQLRRGGSTTPSRWMLLGDPTLELFEDADSYRSKKPTPTDTKEQRINDLNTRIGALEEMVEILWDDFIMDKG